MTRLTAYWSNEPIPDGPRKRGQCIFLLKVGWLRIWI